MKGLRSLFERIKSPEAARTAAVRDHNVSVGAAHMSESYTHSFLGLANYARTLFDLATAQLSMLSTPTWTSTVISS